jgi:hypothetical protein
VTAAYTALGYAYTKHKSSGLLRASAARKGVVATGAAGGLLFVLLFALNATDTPLNLDTPARACAFAGLLLFAAGGAATSLVTFPWKRQSGAADTLPIRGLVVATVSVFLALGVARYPVLLPPGLTVDSAAGPHSTMVFILVGIGLNMPLVLAYNVFAHRAFAGKFPTEPPGEEPRLPAVPLSQEQAHDHPRPRPHALAARAGPRRAASARRGRLDRAGSARLLPLPGNVRWLPADPLAVADHRGHDRRSSEPVVSHGSSTSGALMTAREMNETSEAGAAGQRQDDDAWLAACAAPGRHWFGLSGTLLTLESVCTITRWAALAWMAQQVMDRATARETWGLAAFAVASVLAVGAGWTAGTLGGRGARAVATGVRRQLTGALLPAAGRISETGPAEAAWAMVDLADDVADYHARAAPLRRSAPLSMLAVLAVTAVAHWPAAIVLLLTTALLPLNMRLAGLFAQQGRTGSWPPPGT